MLSIKGVLRMSSVEELNERLVRSWVNDVLKGGGKNAEEWLLRIRERAPDYYDENYVAHHDPTSKGRDGLITYIFRSF